MKKTKTLLAIGDLKDFDTFRKFYNSRRFFYGSKIAFKHLSYNNLLKDKFPKINTNEVIIFLFFPFYYWDKYIEPKNYKGVYGNKTFYTKFKDFWKIVEKKVKTQYKDKKIQYINHPRFLATDRDKAMTKRMVEKAKVNVPKTYNTRKVKDILNILEKEKKLFIKVKFGSMGKGITYLSKESWKTNFRFRDGKIVSKRSDYGWTFIDVTGKLAFLRELLKKDVIIEDAIEPLIINKKKMDIRFYVYKDKVIRSYARTTSTDNVTTNISQGAKGEKQSFLKMIPRRQMHFAKRSAVKAIKALGLRTGGVDIMPCSDKKTAQFIEINTFPGMPKIRSFNLSRYLIREIIKDFTR